MNEVKIEKLIEQCITFFQDNNYTEKRIGRYRSLWKNGITKFMREHSMTLYNRSIGEAFTQSCHYHGTVRPQEREYIRSVQVLDDMLYLGHIRKRCFTPKFYRLDGPIGQEMGKLIIHLTNLRRSKVTIGDYRLYLSEFLHHLNKVPLGFDCYSCFILFRSQLFSGKYTL